MIYIQMDVPKSGLMAGDIIHSVDNFMIPGIKCVQSARRGQDRLLLSSQFLTSGMD